MLWSTLEFRVVLKWRQHTGVRQRDERAFSLDVGDKPGVEGTQLALDTDTLRLFGAHSMTTAFLDSSLPTLFGVLLSIAVHVHGGGKVERREERINACANPVRPNKDTPTSLNLAPRVD